MALAVFPWSQIGGRPIFVLHKDVSDLKAKSVARKALRESWHDVERWGARIDELSIAERHEMRKALKRLRYQIEAFEPVLDRKRTKAFIQRLSQLQDVFGYLNDVSMAENLTHMKISGGADRKKLERMRKHVLDWHVQRSARAWRTAKKSWSVLRKADKAWA